MARIVQNEPKLFCGTSGFAYPTWKPRFYPASLPAKRFLDHYAARLNAVEINYTFRRLPSAAVAANWVRRTPPGFAFALKAPMRITHIGRLRPSEFTGRFFEAVEPLRQAARLGPILFQLPPNMRRDAVALSRFLKDLPPRPRYAFEFRDASWFEDGIYALLEKFDAALCWSESDDLAAPQVSTAGFVYLRLRKRRYPPKEREALARRIENIMAEKRDAYVFFKHEASPANARHAMKLLAGARPR